MLQHLPDPLNRLSLSPPHNWNLYFSWVQSLSPQDLLSILGLLHPFKSSVECQHIMLWFQKHKPQMLLLKTVSHSFFGNQIQALTDSWSTNTFYTLLVMLYLLASIGCNLIFASLLKLSPVYLLLAVQEGIFVNIKKVVADSRTGGVHMTVPDSWN